MERDIFNLILQYGGKAELKGMLTVIESMGYRAQQMEINGEQIWDDWREVFLEASEACQTALGEE